MRCLDMKMRQPSLPTIPAERRDAAMRQLGANIRRERVRRLISQHKLAAMTALHVRTIARIEAGELNIRPETIDRIREAIGCPINKLI